MTVTLGRPQLFVGEGADARPLGVACATCGALQFPAAERCRMCGGDAVCEIALAATGTLETFAPGAGGVFGEVRLADGVLVAGRIVPAEAAAVGAGVRFSPVDGAMRFEIHD